MKLGICRTRQQLKQQIWILISDQWLVTSRSSGLDFSPPAWRMGILTGAWLFLTNPQKQTG